jgi:hypothetical protein
MLPSRPLPPGFILPCLPTPGEAMQEWPGVGARDRGNHGGRCPCQKQPRTTTRSFGRTISGWWAPAEPHAMGVQQQES